MLVHRLLLLFKQYKKSKDYKKEAHAQRKKTEIRRK